MGKRFAYIITLRSAYNDGTGEGVSGRPECREEFPVRCETDDLADLVEQEAMFFAGAPWSQIHGTACGENDPQFDRVKAYVATCERRRPPGFNAVADQLRSTNFPWPTQRPRPGDLVRLAKEDGFYAAKLGETAIVDSVGRYGRGKVQVCFKASAHRETRSNGRGWFVSCSGGPLPLIDEGALRPAGTGAARFWRWKDGVSGAGRGEPFELEVNVWDWDGDR